jgi:ribosome-binding factor A
VDSKHNNKSKSISNNQRKQLLEYCGQNHEDDCVDPKEYFKPDRQTDKANKKAKQLCRQAAHTLDFVLADCDDESMEALFVVSVNPAPDSSRLLVTIGADVSADQLDLNLIRSRLQDQTPRLRAELARSISRKRVPNLIFDVVAKSQLDGSASSQEASSDRKEQSDE